MAEFTVAIYDVQTRILVIHETAIGLSPSMIARYWQLLCPGVPNFRFDPIMEGRARDQMMTAGAVSKFSVSLAHMGNEGQLERLGLTHHEVTDLIPFYRAPTIAVTMKSEPGTAGGTLLVERIRELANALLPLPRKNLKKLSLVVRDAEGDSVLVNLLKDRMVYEEQLTADEIGEVNDEIRYRAARNAWRERKHELRERYQGVD